MKRVEMIPPPANLLRQAEASMAASLAALPPDARGAFMGVVTEKGMNIAVVTKFSNDWRIEGWIGKTWGHSIEGKAQVIKTW